MCQLCFVLNKKHPFSVSQYILGLSLTFQTFSKFSLHISFLYHRLEPSGPNHDQTHHQKHDLRLDDGLVYIYISIFIVTSPNAPLPITFTVWKSCMPNLVLRNRRYCDSFLPRDISCLDFFSSLQCSFCNFSSNNEILVTELSGL